MAEKTGVDCFCKDHTKHMSELGSCQRACEDNREDHRELYGDMKEKVDTKACLEYRSANDAALLRLVPMSYFALLTTFVMFLAVSTASLASWQMKLYQERQEVFTAIKTSLAEIKTELKLRPTQTKQVDRP